jgi:hypothetical protein
MATRSGIECGQGARVVPDGPAIAQDRDAVLPLKVAQQPLGDPARLRHLATGEALIAHATPATP